jgi:hypothetical protein
MIFRHALRHIGVAQAKRFGAAARGNETLLGESGRRPDTVKTTRLDPDRTSTIRICRAAQYYYIAKGLLDHLISGNKQRLRDR